MKTRHLGVLVTLLVLSLNSFAQSTEEQTGTRSKSFTVT
jgi:hypothetical protein